MTRVARAAAVRNFSQNSELAPSQARLRDHDGASCRFWVLLDAEARDRTADDQLLDLFGAFEDVVGRFWTYPLVPDVARFHPLSWGNADQCCPQVTTGYPYLFGKVGMESHASHTHP